MKTKPKKWTHHHTRRMYHLSMLAIFVFIVLTILFGLFVLVTGVQAGSTSLQEDVGVSVTVPGIAGGPSTTTPETVPIVGIYPSIPPVVPSPAAPAAEITIVPTPASVYQKINLGDPESGQIIYVISSPAVGFNGQTSIPFARVVLLLVGQTKTLQDVVYADKNGNFSWQPPEPLEEGSASLTAIAQDPQDLNTTASTSINLFTSLTKNNPLPTTFPTAPNVPTAPKSLSLMLLLRIGDEYKNLYPGQAFVAQVLIETPKGTGAKYFPVEFSVIDSRGNIISTSKESIISGQYNFKTFYTKPTQPSGNYTIRAKILQKNFTYYASDTVTLKGRSVIAIGTEGFVDYTRTMELLFGLLLFFLFLAYFEYNKVVLLSRQISLISEEDLKKLK